MMLKKLPLAAYILWVTFNFILWAINGFKFPSSTINKGKTAVDHFFILTRGDLEYYYDLSEFLVYLIVPVAIFYAFKVILAPTKES